MATQKENKQKITRNVSVGHDPPFDLCHKIKNFQKDGQQADNGKSKYPPPLEWDHKNKLDNYINMNINIIQVVLTALKL